MGVVPHPAFAYVAEETSPNLNGTIRIFQIRSDGVLVPHGGPVLLPAKMSPLSIKLSHTGRFAYVVTEGSLGVGSRILTYESNPSTGDLTLRQTVEASLLTGASALSPDGRFFYATSSGASPLFP